MSPKYKLYDKNGLEIQHHDLQDKSPWCEAGASQELVFVKKYGKKLNIEINPEKKHDKNAPDLINTKTRNIGDLKVQNTPFFQADIRYGIDPQYAVVFNFKDKIRYEKKYPDIDIYFWVDWVANKFVKDTQKITVEPMSGIWLIPFSDLQVMLTNAPLHYYAQRRYDTKGNAKASYVLDLLNPAFKKVV